MSIKIIKEKINKDELKQAAQESFGDMVKAVVDIKQGIMALGAELHSDAENVLLNQGSGQNDLWGINIYPDEIGEEMIEFSSLINIRPALNNRTVEIQDLSIKKKIMEVVHKLILWT
jgi:hypothetical protein